MNVDGACGLRKVDLAWHSAFLRSLSASKKSKPFALITAKGGEVAQTLIDLPTSSATTCHRDVASILVPSSLPPMSGDIYILLVSRQRRIVTHLAFVVYEPDMGLFALLNPLYMRHGFGPYLVRLERGIRYSIEIGYNTFPGAS